MKVRLRFQGARKKVVSLIENDPGRVSNATRTAGVSLLLGGVVQCIVFLLLEFVLLMATSRAHSQAPASPGVLLQAATEKEAYGDYKSAVELYQKISADSSAPRDVRARALLRLAGCDETLGRQARQIYEQIVRDFGDQAAAVQARKWLAGHAEQKRPAQPATMSERKLDWSKLGSMGPTDTDGERAVYRSDENLYFGDLAGHTKRLIFTGNHFAWIPCRDFSLVLLDLLSTPTRPHTLAVIKTDGTGYRTLILDDAKNSIFEQNQSFAMSCSWDDRNILLSDFSLKSTIPGQLWIVSVADGHRRILADVKGWRIRKAVFSPDGRFAAYEVQPRDVASKDTSRVFVVPVAGGESRQVYESAPWQAGNQFLALMDWTADGRYLILRDVRQGKSALYLLPMKDGENGTASFVRFGDFDEGYTTAAGALVYEETGADLTRLNVSLASIGPDDRIGDWHSLGLSTNGDSDPRPSISPDRAQIVYIARDADPVRRDVMVRDLATGQERAIYRSSYGFIVCRFSARPSSIFCSVQKERGVSDLISIAVESGAVEKIATFPGPRFLLGATRDDETFFFCGNAWFLGVGEPPLVRWDRSTNQETIIEPEAQDRRVLSVSSDGRWVVRLLNGMVSIRPITGGDWKLLASGVTVRLPAGIMPDGKWVLYQTADSAGRLAFFRVPTDGGSPERLGDLTNDGIADFAFSLDGLQVVAWAPKPGNYSLSVLDNFVPKAKK